MAANKSAGCDTPSTTARRIAQKSIVAVAGMAIRWAGWRCRQSCARPGREQNKYPSDKSTNTGKATYEPFQEKNVLVGRKDAFAVRFAFQRDPHGGQGAKSEKSVSWGIRDMGWRSESLPTPGTLGNGSRGSLVLVAPVGMARRQLGFLAPRGAAAVSKPELL